MALFLAICLLIGLFSACGGAAAPSSAAPESAAEAASATEAVEEAAPAVEAAEAGSTEEAAPVEEGSLLEDAGDGVPYEDTFEEGAGVWPICDPGEKTITIWDGFSRMATTLIRPSFHSPSPNARRQVPKMMVSRDCSIWH